MGQKEMEEMLCKEFELLTSVDITSKEEGYVFDIVTNSESVLAASFSNHTIGILDLETLTSNHSWKAHSKKITELKFSPENHCHLLSSSLDGTIRLWDIRQPPEKASCCFQDISSNKPKPLMSFDINCTARYICGGTELIQLDAYIIFWDIRNTKALGGYWDSHTDDITQLKFHPSKKDTLISGSTDGLINLFDISESTEEDALISTLNTESSVSKLNWIPDTESKLSCITHTHDLKVWNAFEPSPCVSITRDDFKNKADIKAPVDYLVDVLKFTPKIQLMSGSFNGSSCIWDIREDHFNVRNVLAKGHIDVVRTCRWNEKMKAVITGGEDGVVSIWKEMEQNPTSLSTVEYNLGSESTTEEHNILSENESEEMEDANLASESRVEPNVASENESKEMDDANCTSESSAEEPNVTSDNREEMEDSILTSESKKMKAVCTGGEEGIVSIWKEMEQNPTSQSTVEHNLGSESTTEEHNILSENKSEEMEDANLASESRVEPNVAFENESKEMDDANCTSESTAEPNATSESNREEMEDSILTSESKKISSAVMKRESRKFWPY